MAPPSPNGWLLEHLPGHSGATAQDLHLIPYSLSPKREHLLLSLLSYWGTSAESGHFLPARGRAQNSTAIAGKPRG